MKKITLTQLRSRLKNYPDKDKELEVYFCPSRFAPSNHPFNMCIPISLSQKGQWLKDTEEYRPLENLINEFMVYNCNTETGRSVHYYVKEEV
jgi:hypothetical protein